MPRAAGRADFGRLRLATAVAFIAVAGGCGSEATAPTMASVSGAYDATVFNTTTSGTVTDQLARDASLTLQLSANGTVTGALLIPDDGVNGAVAEAMTGTWTLNGNTVTFTQSADTFVRDMDWTVGNGVLSGDDTFGGTRIQITLTQANSGGRS